MKFLLEETLSAVYFKSFKKQRTVKSLHSCR